MLHCLDLLRIEKTSGGSAREKTKCNINRVLIGSVSCRLLFSLSKTRLHRTYGRQPMQLTRKTMIKPYIDIYGVWWLSGWFGALCPEGRRFESHSGCHIGTLLLHTGSILAVMSEGCGGSVVSSVPCVRKVAGSNPTLAAT